MLALCVAALLTLHPSADAFKKEIHLTSENPSERACHFYLIHHGSTAYSEIKRLQGWKNLPLSERGKKEAQVAAERLCSLGISAIYTSSLQSAFETGEIIQGRTFVPLHLSDELRGEYHGKFDGLLESEYQKEPHFQFYQSLESEDELFYPCGEGGESKAEVVQRVFRQIRKIAAKHPGEKVALITHGGVFKVLNFYTSGDLISISYGDMLEIDADVDQITHRK